MLLRCMPFDTEGMTSTVNYYTENLVKKLLAHERESHLPALWENKIQASNKAVVCTGQSYYT